MPYELLFQLANLWIMPFWLLMILLPPLALDAAYCEFAVDGRAAGANECGHSDHFDTWVSLNWRIQ